MIKHVEIIYDQIEENEEYNKLIEKVINECFKNENMQGLKLYVSITLTVPEVIHELNREYRNIDRPTDVISFALEEDEDYEVKERLLGDIYISIDKVYEQAKEYGHSVKRELFFLVTHGFLHLLGYDHMNEEDEKEMFSLQEKILDSYGVKRV